MDLNDVQLAEFGMLVLVIGREGRGDGAETMTAIAWSIRNRVDKHVERYGYGWIEVITKRWQYSSINGLGNDPNLRVYADLTQTAWQEAAVAAHTVYGGTAIDDPTGGAVSYFDKSLDPYPPLWARSGEFVHTYDVGRLHFFKEK
jgi:hypothetical protein